ncbi:hypothetical protein ACA910_012212 [Epithemia clementina (nom. ined.)]
MIWTNLALRSAFVLSVGTSLWTSPFLQASTPPSKKRAKATRMIRRNHTRNRNRTNNRASASSWSSWYDFSSNSAANNRNSLSYLDHKSEETTAEQSLRFLSTSEEDAYFKPLDCKLPPCHISTTWTERGYDPSKGTVVIPCGTCVWMDFDSDETLDLPYGIDIQGHLYFPDGYHVTIRTPFVLVQGLLDMDSSGTVTNEPLIKFIIDASRQSVSFFPAHNNENVCPVEGTGKPGKCDIGFRAVAVAGGKINARGLPKDCTTWTQLYDVDIVGVASEQTHLSYTKLPGIDKTHSNPSCRSNYPFIDDDFETNTGEWTGGDGGSFKLVNGALAVMDRKSTDEGPTYDLVLFQECLVPYQKYLFSARVRLDDRSDEPGRLTPCNAAGCLELVFSTRLPDGRRISRSQQMDFENIRYKNGYWDNFYATVELTEEELHPLNTFSRLQLVGASPRFDVFMDDVILSLPDKSLVPDPNNLCGNNLVMNGDAEGHDIHPYPMEAVGGAHLTVQTLPGTENRAFLISQRSNSDDSLAYYLDAPNCVTTLTSYTISARVYVDSKVPVDVVIRYRITMLNGDTFADIAAKCSPSQQDWVQCSSKFSIPNNIIPETIESVLFWFRTIDAPNVDYMVDDFVIEVAQAAKAAILVHGDGIKNCWGEGAEILITSHTTNWNDSQVRRLVFPPIRDENEMVRLYLNETIAIPVTAKQDQRFPVEVALLSRNIRFEAVKDTRYPLMGGHFMVLRTPGVNQHIEGIEVVNFGQQGNLGRYPIHLHLCKNAYSLIAKNTVRDSNQRCVVIHGSHNTTIQENIAYNTCGHCFLTEDGGEVNNKFVRNLGSNTIPAVQLVRDGESDANNAATFWSANPMNEWTGNVAAGSEANGFWLELLDFVKLPSALMETSRDMKPRSLPLIKFVNNVAHSNARHGLKMYPHGLLPSAPAVFEDFKSYKNRLTGVFFRNMDNVVVQRGILADNRYQADFDLSDSVVMRGTTVIGSTDRYNEMLQTKVVSNHREDRLVGLELHPSARNPSKQGLSVLSIAFEGFDKTLSEHTALIQIDADSNDPWTGNFNYWTTFKNINVKDKDFPFHFDFNESLWNSTKGIYLVDVDSTMNPSSSDATGTSTVIADSEEVKAFVDLNKCTTYKEGRYLYCRETCLRSITFGVDPGQSDHIRLRIRTDPPGTSYVFEGYQDVFINDDIDRHVRALTDLSRLRYFSAALPPGRYQAMFLHNITGEQLWPTFVETFVEPSLCSNSFDNNDVELVIPATTGDECRDLIRNGDMEESAVSLPYWLQHDTMLEVARNRGRKGSKALTEIDQRSPVAVVGQYIDTRCLKLGETYLLQAWVYVEEGGIPTSCDEKRLDVCPRLLLGIQLTQTDRSSSSFADFVSTIAGSFAKPFTKEGWNLLQGVATVDQNLASASKAALFIDRRKAGMKLFVDDVSMTRIPKDCSELVFNGDFSESTSLYWGHDDGTLDLVSANRNSALEHSRRSQAVSSITQRIQTGCMQKGERYLARAKARVLKPDGSSFPCTPSKVYGDAACPRFRLKADSSFGYGEELGVSEPGGNIIATTDYGLTSEGWLTVSGAFSATDDDEIAYQNVLHIEGPPQGITVVVDEVSIVPLFKNCEQLILNGDAEWGKTALLWRLSSLRELPEIRVIAEASGNQVFQLTGRETSNDGIAQGIDDRCMTLGSKWRVQAKMKFRSRSMGTFVTCVPVLAAVAGSSCPAVFVSAVKEDGSLAEEVFSMTNNILWKANDYNKYECIVEITRGMDKGQKFQIGFRNFDSDWDLFIDDISVKPFNS